MTTPVTVTEMLHRLLRAEGQGRAAKTVEIYGWVGGIGLLYVLSGRLNANGFVFAPLLDRPLVLPILGILWYFGMVAGTLALAAGLQDLLTCLWTLTIWRQEFGRGETAST